MDMIEVKTSELTGAALDYAVSQIEHPGHFVSDWHLYSSNWAQGGPIIERELIDVQAKFNSGSDIVPKGTWYWQAATVDEDDVAYWFDGPTPLIAAMRCYVSSKLGDVVSIPTELVGK